MKRPPGVILIEREAINERGVFQMMNKHQAGQIAKGIGIGMAVGGAVGLVGGAMQQPKYQRSAKKGFNKAMKTIGNVLEAIA